VALEVVVAALNALQAHPLRNST